MRATVSLIAQRTKLRRPLSMIKSRSSWLSDVCWPSLIIRMGFRTRVIMHYFAVM